MTTKRAFALFLALSAFPLSAAEFSVSPAGNDTNPGTALAAATARVGTDPTAQIAFTVVRHQKRTELRIPASKLDK